jgi:tetratricopeptide (TPR) repeat protein
LEGSYRFSALREGAYTLRTEMAGYSEATFGPCVLGQKETKKIDLTLKSLMDSSPQSGSAATLEFFDEPEFTVAGVTEATNPGGHGSDAILRSSEELEKETVSLSKESSSNSHLAPFSAAKEDSLREAIQRVPGNYGANRELGKLLVDYGKAGEALPYLERASQLNPSDYENAYELALAYVDAGEYERAHTEVRTLLTFRRKAGQDLGQPDKAQEAELHHLLGDVEEKLGHPLEAVQEYQRAAELNPSERDLFDWGANLLMHRAFEPAIEVFSKGSRLYPRSDRMLTGLGVAWYARGAYDQAARDLCAASDLDPGDPTPYLFMGEIQSVGTIQSACIVQHLRRFVRLYPENALANYYYALGLWNRQEAAGEAKNFSQVQSLLEQAVRLNPKLGEGYLQLGMLYSDHGDIAKAISAYQEAIEASPALEEVHYRLAQAYSRTGEKLKAQTELQLYNQLSKKTAEEVERERREIQQFVYTLRGSTAAPQPQ